MCRILGVKRANYYKWLHHEKSTIDKENEEIAELIKTYHKKYNGLLGYRMMTNNYLSNILNKAIHFYLPVHL